MKNLVVKKDTIVKKYQPHCPAAENHSIAEWFDLYKEYRKKDSRCVEVFNIDTKNSTFEMQKIEGFVLNEYAKVFSLPLRDRYNIIGEVAEIYSRFFKPPYINPNERQVFMHMDMHVANIMYSNTGEVRLIDPDSFSLTYMDEPKQVFYGRYFDTMIYLKECLTK